MKDFLDLEQETWELYDEAKNALAPIFSKTWNRIIIIIPVAI